MQKLTLFLFLAFLVLPVFAKDTYVHGYTRKDGTYVSPHYRSAPNSTVYDNYSTKGNINPHTGEYGTKNYDSYSNYDYSNNSNNTYNQDGGYND